jgi:hypothetical protein
MNLKIPFFFNFLFLIMKNKNKTSNNVSDLKFLMFLNKTFEKIDWYLRINKIDNKKINYDNYFCIITGKIIVELFSTAISFKVCKYLSCNAIGDILITTAASFSATAAFFSHSAVPSHIKKHLK